MNFGALSVFPLGGNGTAVRLPDNSLFHFDTGEPVPDYHNRRERPPNQHDRKRFADEGFPAPMLARLLHPRNSQVLFPDAT